MISTFSPSIGTHLDRIRRANGGGSVIVNVCEICGITKSRKIHAKCSKIKQKRLQERGYI